MRHWITLSITSIMMGIGLLPGMATPPPAPVNTVQTIIDDMTAPHDAPPHGVPAAWRWAQGPEIHLGNQPGHFTAMTAWGQLYEVMAGNPATNSRVQIRGIQAFLLSKTNGKWRQLQRSTLVEGAAYREDFSEDAHHPADVRQEADGTISVTAGGGYNFHFLTPGDRAALDPTDIAGIFTTCQARLIVGNPNAPDDRAQARLVMDMGGDYWASLTAEWAPQQANNDDIGMGRFKLIRVDWQAFNMCTVPAAQLRDNPPPLE